MSCVFIFGPDSKKNEDITVALATKDACLIIVPVDKAAEFSRSAGIFVADDMLEDANLIFNHHVNGVEHQAIANDVPQNWVDRFADLFQQRINQPDIRSQTGGLEFNAQWSIEVSGGDAGVQFYWPSIQASVLWLIAQQLEDTYEACC